MATKDGPIIRKLGFSLASTPRLVALLHRYKDLRDVAADDITAGYARGCIAAIRAELRRRESAGQEVAA